jgi:hypothetical protein
LAFVVPGAAEPIVEAAWDQLIDNDRKTTTIARMDKRSREDADALHLHARQANSFVQAVSQAPMEIARSWQDKVFRELQGINDAHTTASHFSLAQLGLVESAVLAIVARRDAAERS